MNTINLQFGDPVPQGPLTPDNYEATYLALKKREKYKRAKADAERGKDLAGFVGRYIDINDPKHRQVIYPLIIQPQNIRFLGPEATTQTRKDLYSSKEAKNAGIVKLQELSKNPEYKKELQDYMDKKAEIDVLQVMYSRDADKFESTFTNKTLMERFNRTGRFSALMKCTAHHGLPQAIENLPYLTATVKLQKKIEKVSLWECIRTFSFRKTVYLRKLRKQFDQDPSSIDRHELEVIAANKDYCKRFCDKNLTEDKLQNHINTLKQPETIKPNVVNLELSEPVLKQPIISPKVDLVTEPAPKAQTVMVDSTVTPRQATLTHTVSNALPQHINLQQPLPNPEVTVSNTCTDVVIHTKPQPRYTLASPILEATETKLSSFSRIMRTLINDYQHDVMGQSQSAVGPVLVGTKSTGNTCQLALTSGEYTKPTDPSVTIKQRFKDFQDNVTLYYNDELTQKAKLALARILTSAALSYTSGVMNKEAYTKIKENFDFLLEKFELKYENLTLRDINNISPTKAMQICHSTVMTLSRKANNAICISDCKEELSNIFTFIVWGDKTLRMNDPDIRSILMKRMPTTPNKEMDIKNQSLDDEGTIIPDPDDEEGIVIPDPDDDEGEIIPDSEETGKIILDPDDKDDKIICEESKEEIIIPDEAEEYGTVIPDLDDEGTIIPEDDDDGVVIPDPDEQPTFGTTYSFFPSPRKEAKDTAHIDQEFISPQCAG